MGKKDGHYKTCTQLCENDGRRRKHIGLANLLKKQCSNKQSKEQYRS